MLGFKPRPGSHREGETTRLQRVGRTTRFWGRTSRPRAKKRPRGSIVVNGEDHKVLGEKEETTRLQSKWGGDHAALKEGVNHEALKQVDR